jgi:hypothetical protein
MLLAIGKIVVTQNSGGTGSALANLTEIAPNDGTKWTVDYTVNIDDDIDVKVDSLSGIDDTAITIDVFGL